MNTVKIIPTELTKWPRLLSKSNRNPHIDLWQTSGDYDAPDGWRARQSDLENELLYFVREGTMAAAVGNVELQVPSGALLWVARGQAVHFRRHLPGALRFYRLRFAVTHHNGSVYRLAPGHLFVPGLRDGALWMRQLVNAASQSRDTAHIRGLLLCLITNVMDELAKDPADHGLTTAQQRSVEERAGHDWAHRPSLRELASAAGLSPDYFSRLFTRTYGMPPRSWLVQQRTQIACTHLKESTLTVSEIADCLGYRDIYHFSRQFREVTGVSPTRYRRM